MGKSIVHCPLPNCPEANLAHHCRHNTKAGQACTWLICPSCKVVIDPRRWRAFSTQDGSPVELPPR